MIVTPLDARSGRAVRDALIGHGWDDALAADAAAGLAQTVVHLEGLDASAIEALVPFAGTLGLELLTGANWVLLAGSTSRLAALARPWLVPPPLAGIATGVGSALAAVPPPAWRVAGRSLALDVPVIMGILNVTPDSFSDGGRYRDVDAAVAQAEQMAAAGAAIIDVGGESTRPNRGAEVSAEEEQARVLPVINALASTLPHVALSVDTMKADVARAALAEGAHIINDVTALRHDPALAEVAAAAGAGLVLMHSRGAALELASYTHAHYERLVPEVRAELSTAVSEATARGVARDSLVLDPGFGFSKRPEENILLADQLSALAALGLPLLVGPSRKRFLGQVSGAGVDARDHLSAVFCALCFERGARLFRVHDVALARDALRLAQAFGGSFPDA
ncbi:MAG TPA: dihydropteroate synthase [Gemmatimonadales bacterium]|nr:dihydropteroate synthase [Gemmatimonadales bacterium]